MIDVDVDVLTAAELDTLIARALERRAQLLPAHAVDAPIGEISAVMDPRWKLGMDGDRAVLQLLHPGAGWLAFLIPPAERVHLVRVLFEQCVAPPATGAP